MGSKRTILNLKDMGSLGLRVNLGMLGFSRSFANSVRV